MDLRKIIEDREERSRGSRNVLRRDIRTTEQGCLWGLVELMNNPCTAQRSCGLRKMRNRASASPVLGRKCLQISQDGEIVCLNKSECTSGCGEGLSIQPGRLSRGSQAGGCFALVVVGGLVSKSCLTLVANFWTVAHQAPLSIGFSRQEHWHGLPFPSPGGCFRMWLFVKGLLLWERTHIRTGLEMEVHIELQ